MKLRWIPLVALASAVLAQGPGGGRMQPRLDALKAALGLTDSQVEAFQQLRRQQAEAARPLFEQIGQKQRELEEKVRGGSTDAASLGSLLIEIQNLRARARDAEKGVRDQAVNALTPEQRAKLTTLEEAVKLQAAIGQAAGLGLLTPPANAGDGPGFGPGGPGIGPRGRAPGGPGPRR